MHACRSTLEDPTILDYGLTTRWTNSFLPFTDGPGRGGVPHEGTQYGRGVMDYYTIPLTTATLLGRDIWNETDYFKDSIFYLIYSMTPAKTTLKGSTSTYFETYPYNDDETWNQGNSAASGDIGTYLTPLLEIWKDSPLSGYIQQYLNVTGAGAERYVQSVAMPATPTPFDGLAFDFFAPGIQYFYTRTGWGADAMAINMQLGVPKGVGHNHLDAGTFQISRKGRWLTRETVTYTDQIAGWNNSAAADGRAAFGHNAVLFQGKGQVDTFDGPPEMLRLESRDAYSYAAVDLTPSYKGGDNAAVQKIIREFLFIRPLETLVILDRMAATSASSVKSFVLHSETTSPAGSGSTVIQNGDQGLQVITLLPAGAPYRVIQEGGSVGQYRLEVDSSGAAESYFLHVLHGKDMSAPNLQASVTDTGSGWQVSITNPSGGVATVTFEKGLTSQGGSFGYAASGTPSPEPLIDHVQTMDMTDTGPAWR